MTATPTGLSSLFSDSPDTPGKRLVYDTPEIRALRSKTLALSLYASIALKDDLCCSETKAKYPVSQCVTWSMLSTLACTPEALTWIATVRKHRLPHVSQGQQARMGVP